MQFTFKFCKTAAFAKKVHKIVAVNGSRFHSDNYSGIIKRLKYRSNSVNKFCAPILLLSKVKMLCLLPSDFIKYATLLLLLISMPT